MSNLLGPRDENGIPVPMTVDESIASMKASLLKKLSVPPTSIGWTAAAATAAKSRFLLPCRRCSTPSVLVSKVVPSPRHADILLFTGAVTRAMRSPALRAWQSAPDPKICISYGACGNSGGIFTTSTACGRDR